MLEKLKKNRILVCLRAFSVLEVIALLLAPAWYDNTTLLNSFLFIVVSYLAISPFLGRAHHWAWGIIWSLLVVGSLGWFFGIIEVLLYWYLFSKKKKNTTTRGTETDTSNDNIIDSDSFADGLEAINNENNRPRNLSTGKIHWKILKKGMAGQLSVFRPKMWCNIPQFWRKIEFIQSGKTITVIEHRWFHQPNRQNLVECHDPDYVDSFGNWLIASILRNRQINIVRHGKMSSGKPEKSLRFRLSNSESEKVLAIVEILINDTCTWQGAKRLGHF